MEDETVSANGNSVAVNLRACSRDTDQHRNRQSEVLPPDYVLDFGYVIPGQVVTGVLNLTNSGSVPLSLSVNTKCLAGTGFSGKFDRVKNLPCGGTHAFTVKFNPEEPKGKMGPRSVLVPVQTSHGGRLQVRLSAVVAEPTVAPSTGALQFDTLQCGMCQMKTVQLSNNGPVTCHWNMAEEVKPLKKVDPYLPLYKRKKPRPLPAVFEMVPSSGTLAPGEQVDVQIMFCPAEGGTYSRRLLVCVADSTQQMFLTACGEAEEPQLQFCPSALDLGACLPASTEAEAEVTVKNPCSFPIEFYSLELDKQYLEEEKILQTMQGYNEKNELLLPPIHPGQRLSEELLETHQKRCSHLKEEKSSSEVQSTPAGTNDEVAPRHRGIAGIIYGAPLIDTSSIAVAVANHYGALCLSIDAVVTDVLINGTSPVSLKARELYDSAAAKCEGKKSIEAVLMAEAKPDRETATPASRDPEEPAHQEESSVPLCDLLPLDLLVDILAERFQRSDCCHGVVLDGLASAFTCSTAAMLQVALKALNTYKHVFVISLHDTYGALKEREAAQTQAEEAIRKEEAEKEARWLQSLDDDQWHGLPHEVKERIVQQSVEKLRLKKLRELEQDRKQKEEKEEEGKTRKLKEELMKIKKAGKKDVKDLTKKKPMVEPAATQRMSPHPAAALHPAKEAHSQKHAEETKPAQEDTPVDTRQSQFSAYQKSCDQVEHILQHWDLARGLLLVPLPDKEASAMPHDGSTKKQISAKTTIKNRERSSASSADRQKATIIPHVVLNVAEGEHLKVEDLLKNRCLPAGDQMVDDVEMEPISPPTPPLTIFSIVPYPKRRDEVGKLACDCFTFLRPSCPEDPVKKGDSLDEVRTSPTKAAAGPLRSPSRASAKETAKEQDKKDSRSKRRAPQRVSPLVDVTEQTTSTDQHSVALDLKRKQSLTSFRWIVPPCGEVVLKIWFYSELPGTFAQTFNFELMGTRRLYQLPCRGICTHPSICRNYMTLFPTCKKVETMSGKLQKAYVTDPGYFEFGPLLCSKTRDRYRENRYPENTEKVVIHNNSGLQAEVQFRFQEDEQATTFLLDPPTMSLKPGQKKELTVWAYPTKVGQIKDSVIVSVQDGLEHFSIDLSCWGVQPEVKLDSKHFHFDRIVLHRQDSRTILLHNKAALPVSWRLHGIEDLGDEFSVPHSNGVIAVGSSFPLSLNFKARRPIHVRKILRLEVSDEEKILGIVHSENLLVTAEAYDVALEISPAGCLNFATLKVFEENKLALKIKNQGKYDIAFKFVIQQTAPSLPDLASVFSVSPQSGTLKTHDKATVLYVHCRPNAEFSIRDKPILSCQVIEPKIGDGGGVIAIVAINVSVTSVFSRYKITPQCDLNFGPLAYGFRKSQSFTLENTGALETRFKISMAAPAAPGKKTPPEKPERTAGGKARRESVPKESRSVQSALGTGFFSVSPCAGGLQPGSQQVVTVQCAAEQLGVWNQRLLIDIIDRDPSDHPDGIPYTLSAEVCRPSIVTDMASIFEEHYICRSSRQLSSEPFCSAQCVYIQEENTFLFQKVPVGQSVTAHFKLSNNSKVSCALALAIRNASAKERPTSQEVFELMPSALLIPSQSHSFASVSFTPQMMQVYSAALEATVEQSARLTPTTKCKVLEFHLTGESVLPHVTVLCPAGRNSAGNPVMHFRRVYVGHRRTLPLVLINNGRFPVQAQVDLLDEQDMFTLRPSAGNTCSFVYSTPLEGTAGSERAAARSARMSLNVDEQVRLEVAFCSDRPVKAESRILMRLEDNKHVTTTVQVMGEACQDVVSFHHISTESQNPDPDVDEGGQETLNFGGCYVDHPYQQSFMMTNHSSSRVFRFEWPHARAQLCFSPQVGHLHAGCSKEVTVRFCSTKPVRLRSQLVMCKLCEVTFDRPAEEVPDWDDRQKASRQLTAIKGGDPEEPEPPCSVVEGSHWDADLRVAAVCDYSAFSCSVDSIHFQDTQLYQKRQQQFQIANVGMVTLEFSFQLFLSNNEEEGNFSAEEPVKQQLAPISVEPATGAIEAGRTQTFSVGFSPAEVSQYRGRLVCSIPNLQKGGQAPSVGVWGRGLLPLYHFYLDDSDYISRLSSNPEFTGRLDADTRVIGFEGIAFVPSVRCFDVLNPTSSCYSFTWRCEDSGCSPFHCLHPRGSIPPGKTVQARFQYVSEKTNVVHSSWSFVIESLSLAVPFLCVGVTREPQLYLSKRQIDFGEVPVGCRVQQPVDLVNCEEETFPFAVTQSSLLCEDQKSSLKLEPLSGVALPKARLSLAVSFTPCCQGQKRFRVVLRMKKKPEPLLLTVKASCLPMSASLQVEMPDGVLRQVGPDREETLDFGEMEILETSLFYFLLANQSKFSMEATFELTGRGNLLQHLRAEPPSARADVGAHLRTSLSFSPKGVCHLQDVKLRIKVKLGPTFNFVIKGRSSAPHLEFSFTRHNFGKCLLHRPGMVVASTTLVISNTSKKDVGLQCQFGNTPHLELDFGTTVLSPGAVLDVPVRFFPRELCSYHEKVPFVLNGCITKEVSVLGQGVKMRLEVEDPRQRKINLGGLSAGRRVKTKVKLVNHSTIDLSFKLLLDTQLDLRDLSLSQTGEFNLRAGDGSCCVEILFSPHQRVAAFTAELLAQCAGVFYPLLTLQGSCPGVEVQLDQDHLAFGAVVQHCQASKKIVMTNTGDVGTSFFWKADESAAALTITPAKGFIRPGTDVLLDVTFAPVKLSEDIRHEVSCAVGSSDVVKLTVTGSCVMVSANKEVVQFVCPVRGSHTQMLQVSNPTYQQCRIEPVLKGGPWRIAPFLDFEPLQNKTVELSYQPMVMTVDGRKDSGSLFFSFPDGSGTMFNLQGTAEPPKVEDTIVCQQPAKTQQTVVLCVHNWLPKKQQFRVLMEILKPDRPDATVSIAGLPFIDVPALAKKDYLVSFFAYREGQYHAKVTFQNATSGEYSFYMVSFETLPAGPLSTLELVATVREKVWASVTVENPLSKATCLTMECKCPEISAPSHHTVPGKSKGCVSVEYRPLHARPSTARLTLHCPELGYFHYNLSLSALPAPPEKTVHFHAALGRSHTEPVKFLNYSHVKTDYSCLTDCPDFTVDKTVPAAPGYRQPSEAVVSVCFEPHQLGEARGLLSLNSEIGGKYTFVLRGTCTAPQAQGPFTVKPGRSLNIPFKNVFLRSTTFTVQVNNPCFVVKGFTPVLGPKKTQNMTVYFEVPAEKVPGACCGTLTVSCQATDSHKLPFFWDYYLQGSGSESS